MFLLIYARRVLAVVRPVAEVDAGEPQSSPGAQQAHRRVSQSKAAGRPSRRQRITSSQLDGITCARIFKFIVERIVLLSKLIICILRQRGVYSY